MAELRQFITRSIVQFMQRSTSAPYTEAGYDLGHRRSWKISPNTTNGVDEIFVTTVTIAANTTHTIDLSNSTSNKNPINVGLSMARTKYLYIRAAQTGGHINGVLINGLAANSATDLYKVIPAGGHVECSDPSAAGRLVNSTSKNLVLTNLDLTNSIDVQVVVAGGKS